MLKTNKEILKEAELALNKNWGKSILVNLTYIAIAILITIIKNYDLNFLDTIYKDTFQTVIGLEN